jgi:hypothetical protein
MTTTIQEAKNEWCKEEIKLELKKNVLKKELNVQTDERTTDVLCKKDKII